MIYVRVGAVRNTRSAAGSRKCEAVCGEGELNLELRDQACGVMLQAFFVIFCIRLMEGGGVMGEWGER